MLKLPTIVRQYQQTVKHALNVWRYPRLIQTMCNLYPPYLGAGVKVDQIDFQQGIIQVSMPLTRLNQNIMGTQFGGSLYSMVDPFFMLLLMEKLTPDYVVWDKSAQIDFIKAGEGSVYATFHISNEEINTIKQLAQTGQPVFRVYELDITNEHGEIIAHVHKTLYIRLRAFSRSGGRKSRI